MSDPTNIQQEREVSKPDPAHSLSPLPPSQDQLTGFFGQSIGEPIYIDSDVGSEFGGSDAGDGYACHDALANPADGASILKHESASTNDLPSRFLQAGGHAQEQPICISSDAESDAEDGEEEREEEDAANGIASSRPEGRLEAESLGLLDRHGPDETYSAGQADDHGPDDSLQPHETAPHFTQERIIESGRSRPTSPISASNLPVSPPSFSEWLAGRRPRRCRGRMSLRPQSNGDSGSESEAASNVHSSKRRPGDEEYIPDSDDSEDLPGDEAAEGQGARKRRKSGHSPKVMSGLCRSATNPRRHHIAKGYEGASTEHHELSPDLPSPPLSNDSLDGEETGPTKAKFEECTLDNVIFKRIMLNGRLIVQFEWGADDKETGLTKAESEEWALEHAVFKRIMLNGQQTNRVQFEWEAGANQHEASHRCRDPTTSKRGRTESFSPDEDKLIQELKEGKKNPGSESGVNGTLTWREIHRRFNRVFPGRRTQGSLQVHYSTKLKTREVV